MAWGTLHDQGTEGAHHARVARFLWDNQVQAIAVGHVGPGMQRMLGSMRNLMSPAGPSMGGSAAAAAGGSALTEPGPFGGLLTDRAPAGSPVTGLLMGCRARLGVST